MQKFLISSMLLAGFYTPVQAQDTQALDSTTLPEMVVTATRSSAPRSQLSAATTVYTRADIERKQVKTFPDLLRGTLGLDMTQNGGDGKTTSVFMRGTNSDHILVLVDGIKVGSTTLGTTPFEFVPIDQIERVEIIRGPQSSLYGSEALGGVIQIFTRKGGESQTPHYNLSAGGGSYDTYRAAGNVNGKWHNGWYSLGASSIGTEGINSRQPIQGPFGFSQPDRDGYQNTALNARAGYRFDNKGEFEASLIRAEGTNQFDANFGGDHSEFMTQTIALAGNMNLAENWHTTLRLGQSRDDSDIFFPDNTLDSRYNATRWNISWLNEIAVSDEHRLILGSDYRLDEVDSTIRYTESTRYDVGIFGEYRGQFFDNQFVNVSVRWDENQQFGDYATGSVGWRANWDYGLSTFANFGNAFKAPSFNDLYYPNYGNPNLQPEESTSVEVGLAGNHGWGQWEVRAYHTNIDNLITPVADKNFNFSAQNVGKSQIDGIEAEIGGQFYGWNGKLNLNLLNPEVRETDRRLPRRADKLLSFDVYRAFGPVDVGAYVQAQGYRYDDPQNATKVAGFATVDLRAAYHIDKNWLLSAKLNNLLDKDYQTVNTYNTLGRNFFFTIQYNN